MLAFLFNNIVIVGILTYNTVDFIGSTISQIYHESSIDHEGLIIRWPYFEGINVQHKWMYGLVLPLITGLSFISTL